MSTCSGILASGSRACEDSLKRLATDYIDIFYLHRDFEEDTVEETVAAMGDLIRAGKIRCFALSNFRGWRVSEMVNECKRQGVPKPIACQPYYNLLNRLPEMEILPACGYHGLGVVPYSPIARSVLTGKYKPGSTNASAPEGSRVARADRRFMQTEWREESLVIAQTLEAHAVKRDVNLVQFATAWVLANRFVSSVIAGLRKTKRSSIHWCQRGTRVRRAITIRCIPSLGASFNTSTVDGQRISSIFRNK
jgi:aryl-alcohol dehydrogenase-like predicted oxidoreductase